MSQSGELATFPGKVTLIETVVHWSEEEHSIHNESELVSISQLSWVLGFHHSDLITINY